MRRFLLTVGCSLLALPAIAQDVPVGYPADYAQLVTAAKEQGQVLIYSNMGEDNWGAVIRAFNDVYPDITVENLEMGPAEVFSRYRAEVGTGIGSADFLVAGSIVDWIHASDDGLLADYKSPEIANMPQWSVPLPGLYTFSTDPMVTLYNALLVPEDRRATSMQDYFANVVAYPELFGGKIGTYDGRYAFGESINYAFVRQHGEQTWSWFEAAGTAIKPGGGSGGMIEKCLTGELVSAYFVSAPSLLPKLKDGVEQVLTWSFPSDGTPIFLRGMGVAGQATHPAAARVFLDFLLSEPGQRAIGEGGLTPYRPGITMEGDLRYSLDEVYAAIGGEQNAILINYDRQMLTDEAAFIARWAAAFKM